MNVYLRAGMILSIMLSATQSSLGQSPIVPNGIGLISTHINSAGFFYNGGAAITFSIGIPSTVAASTDARGGFYFATPEHHRVYRVLDSGEIFVVAGSTTGFSGDGGPARSAQLSFPNALAVDLAGNIYLSDKGNSRIRKIDTNGAIRTLATAVSSPAGLAVDLANNLYIADSVANKILKIASDGTLSTFAGTGFTGFSGDGGPAVEASFSGLEGLATDAQGNVYIADSMNHRIRVVRTDGIITTVAGTGIAGFRGDGDPAIVADLNQPRGVAVDGSGNVFIADTANHAVRKVAANGLISTLAGTGVGDYYGDSGPAAKALLRSPAAVSVDRRGVAYIADSINGRIRRITPAGAIFTAAGGGSVTGSDFRPQNIAQDGLGNLYMTGAGSNTIFRVAPNGAVAVFAGSAASGYSGDSGPARQALFASPAGLAFDGSGNLYVADSGNNCIRRIGAGGMVTTIVGNGAGGFSGDGAGAGAARSASLLSPQAVVVDRNGNLFIADTGNHRVRSVTPNGAINTVAGNGLTTIRGDGAATSISLNAPAGLAIEANGLLLISDTQNHRVRRLMADGTILTIAGEGIAGFTGDGQAAVVRISAPMGLAVDSGGNIYIADSGNNKVRRVSPTGLITTVAGTGAAGYSGDSGQGVFAALNAPSGVIFDPGGILYIADTLNSAIRRLPATYSSSFSIANAGAVSSETSGNGAALSTGYATIQPTGGTTSPAGMAIFGFREKGVLVSEASVPAAAALRSGRIYAEVNGPVNTGLAVANPNVEAAVIRFYFTDATGDFRNGSFTIAGNEQFTAFLNQAPFNGGSAVKGSFTFVSSVPVAVTALRGFTNERGEFLITTLPVADLDASPESGTIWIPHFASGGGWKTQVALVNPTETTLAGVVQFTRTNGNDAGRISYSIPPRASQTVDASGASASAVTVGTARIIPSGASSSPSATAVFSYRTNGVTVSEAGVPSVAPSRGFRLYAEASGDFAGHGPGSIQTGLAIANTTSSPVTITLSIGPEGAFAYGVGSFTLAASAQVAVFLNEIAGFEALPKALQSVVRMQASQEVSVIGLRARYNERGDLLITTTAPADELSPASAVPMYFAHFADAGGYKTQFVLFSGKTNQTPAGLMKLFSKYGEPLPPSR